MTRGSVLRLGASLLVGIVAFLLFLEAGLRIFEPFEIRIRNDRIRLPVNRRYEITNDSIPALDRRIVHTRNSLGFRGPEPPARWDSRLTILTVGGSTTECFYLSDGETWPDRLAEALAERLDGVWLDNAGLDGHSTFGHRILLEQLVLEMRPDVVLFLVGINDVGRHDLDPYYESRLRRRSRTKPGFFASTEVAQLWTALRRRVKTIRFGLPHRALRLEEIPVLEDPPDRASLLLDHEGTVASYEARLRRLVEITAERGIAPVLITQPALYGPVVDARTGIDLGPLDVEGVDAATRWAILERYNDATRRVGREQGVLVIDLASELPKSSDLFYDWLHYTAAGAQELARLVAAELAPWLERRFPEHAR